MKKDHFSEKDLILNPTLVQREIVKDHQEIGGYNDVHYLNDGISVLFEFDDGECVKVKKNSLDN